MKKFQLELNAAQVLALYDMCEFTSSAQHATRSDPDGHFALVMSIMSKLDGCASLASNSDLLPEVTLLDQAAAELPESKPGELIDVKLEGGEVKRISKPD